MTRRFSLVTALMMVAAIAAAGCGSSSKSKSQPAAVPSATTPPTPSTPSTGTGTTPAPTNVTPSGLSGSTPITSPALRTALVQKLATVKAIQTKFDGPIADCVIKRWQAHGYTTLGDANQHSSTNRADGATCARQVVLGQK